MRPYQVRRRNDGRWEAGPQGADRALFVFDSTDDVTAFTQALARRDARKAQPEVDNLESLPSQAHKRRSLR